jgi:hypothetical protein
MEVVNNVTSTESKRGLIGRKMEGKRKKPSVPHHLRGFGSNIYVGPWRKLYRPLVELDANRKSTGLFCVGWTFS